MSQNAIGMIETKGLIAAIEAADVMLKSANVEIVGSKYYKVRSGIIAVVVTGDVGAVKSAVEAGSDAAKKIGKVLAVDVIARTDKSVLKMLIPQKDKKDEETKVGEKQEKINKNNTNKEKNIHKVKKEEKKKEDKINERQEEIKIEASIQEVKEDNTQKSKMEDKKEEIKIKNSTKEVKLEKNQKDIKKEDNKKSKDSSISNDKLENDDKIVKNKKSKK